MNDSVPWLSLALLGGFHGLNHGMGWLFAVALGLQEGSRTAVVRALGPIALGHAASVAVVVALVGAAQLWIDAETLRLLGGSVLVVFGAYKLALPLSHPRWVGMRVGARDLVVWSFLMATAHGAGLMLALVLFRLPSGPTVHTAHAQHAEHVATMGATAGMPITELLVVALHTAAMFVVMAAVALLVFDRLGLAILRRGWFNLDRVWAGALIGAGGLTLLM